MPDLPLPVSPRPIGPKQTQLVLLCRDTEVDLAADYLAEHQHSRIQGRQVAVLDGFSSKTVQVGSEKPGGRPGQLLTQD